MRTNPYIDSLKYEDRTNEVSEWLTEDWMHMKAEGNQQVPCFPPLWGGTYPYRIGETRNLCWTHHEGPAAFCVHPLVNNTVTAWPLITRNISKNQPSDEWCCCGWTQNARKTQSSARSCSLTFHYVEGFALLFTSIAYLSLQWRAKRREQGRWLRFTLASWSSFIIATLWVECSP